MKIKSILMLSAIVFMFSACKTDNASLTPTEFNDLLSSTKKKQIIDVRTPGEFASGYITDAKNIDIYSADFKNQINNLDKSTPVFVYCKSGGRSSSAANMMLESGFKEVYDLKGGILQWANNDLPLAGVVKPAKTGYSVDQYFDVIKDNDVVLVDFFAPWCGPCKQMAPHVKSIKEKNTEKLHVLKVDTDQSPGLSKHFSISGIPMVKIYVKGEEVYSSMGYHSEEQLNEQLQAYL
jgi:thioredoxin